jgi:ABC-type antimicrobial peptide transport system permease subunit
MIGVLIGAWLDIRSKPLRTVAAIAGMVAAVVAVVVVDAAGVLSRDANREYLARQFGLRITGRVYPERGAPPDIEARLQTALIDNGFTVSPDVGLTFSVQNGSAFPTVSALWVSSAYNKIRIVDLIAGAWPEITARSTVPHVVIGEALATQLGYPGPAAIGQELFFGPPGVGARFNSKTTPLTVAIVDGVAANTTNALADVDLLLVSDLSQRDLLREGQLLSWLVRTNPADYGALIQLVQRITDDGGRPIYSVVRADQASRVTPVLDQQQVTADAVTLVALTVGGLGILGIGLASVRERGTEFGVRRALGASTRRIFVSVIVQTLLEALLAAAIAIPLAAIAVELFTRQLVLDTLPLPSSRSLPVSSALQGLGGALLVGLVAGLIPATNAARTSVVRALRG